MYRRVVLGCMIFLLLSPLVLATTFSIQVTPVKNEISRNDTAVFEVLVNNYGRDDAKFQAYTIDPKWNVRTDPVTPVVPTVEKGIFLLELRPTGAADFGTQGVSITFKDINSETLIKKGVVLNLRSGLERFGDYAPTVSLDVGLPFEVDPREEVPLRLELRNRNQLNISNLSILVTSPHFSRTESIRLAPLSEKTVDLSDIQLDPLTLPEDAELLVMLYYNGDVVNRLEKNYKIKEYTRVRERITEHSLFFKKTKTVTVTNEGNIENTAIITVPTSFFKRMFIDSSLPFGRTEDGSLVWRIPLKPNETQVFNYGENYRILVLLLLFSALGWVAYILLRSPVVVLKEAVGIARKEGVSRIKVRIFIKNRSSRLVRGIQILDKVPSLAEVLKTELPGSMPPSKIAVGKQGTLLRWHLEVLEPYEERVLTYQAKSKLRIIGRMSLPRSKVKFLSRGKEWVVYSNNIELVEKFQDR